MVRIFWERLLVESGSSGNLGTRIPRPMKQCIRGMHERRKIYNFTPESILSLSSLSLSLFLSLRPPLIFFLFLYQILEFLNVSEHFNRICLESELQLFGLDHSKESCVTGIRALIKWSASKSLKLPTTRTQAAMEEAMRALLAEQRQWM